VEPLANARRFSARRKWLAAKRSAVEQNALDHIGIEAAKKSALPSFTPAASNTSMESRRLALSHCRSRPSEVP